VRSAANPIRRRAYCLVLLTVSTERIRDIIRKVDKDGDGAIDFDELAVAMDKAVNRLGVPGSEWKMYIGALSTCLRSARLPADRAACDAVQTLLRA
jgi:hypothetical protein